MGKRKRSGTSFYPSPSDSRPCSSGRDLTPGESSSSAPDNRNIFKSNPSVKETMDTRGKQPISQLSLGQHQHNLSRSVFWKRSRHHYGNQYSRRNSPNYHKPSTSYAKITPFPDERSCFTLGSKYNSDVGHRPDFAEFRESAFWRPERIRSSTSVIHAISPYAVRMTCGVCQKLLKRKPHNFGSTLASEELSIAAVLVCGHIFHADCLEQRTQVEDKRDPPCPICSGFDPQIELIDLERDS
ncbi:uncharacterized protein LOC130815996 isoform X2 [Amaranthus tricolor]|uniref:uncharacterized protein LOC130815996 isoform X2 n=1 Tax=Amaranthus tricolor TaxID=29722 RepID=UPI00258E81E1|nr:uncharacterized protein LOC130815996 isoform X2 [Amaranthus tricolor]